MRFGIETGLTGSPGLQKDQISQFLENWSEEARCMGLPLTAVLVGAAFDDAPSGGS